MFVDHLTKQDKSGKTAFFLEQAKLEALVERVNWGDVWGLVLRRSG